MAELEEGRVIGSTRRNPVIADLFQRLDLMERRGSGFGKVLDAYEFESKKRGLTVKPKFRSTATGFFVVLPNLNKDFSVVVGGDKTTTETTIETTTAPTTGRQELNEGFTIAEKVGKMAAKIYRIKKIKAAGLARFVGNPKKTALENTNVSAMLSGKPNAGNLRTWLDEGEVAPAKPGRGFLLYRKLFVGLLSGMGVLSVLAGEGSAAEAPRMDRSKLLIGTYYLKPVAQDEAHVKAMKECGIDFVFGIDAANRRTLDLLSRYGIGCIATGVFPRWVGGDGSRAGQLEKLHPLAEYTKAAKAFSDHPAIWMADIGDEPSALEFPYYAKVVRETVKHLPAGVTPYLNLYPNYAQVTQNTDSQQLSQLGTATYEEHVDRYAAEVPLDYLSYDYYVYSAAPSRFDGFLEKMYANFETVAAACRRTNRSFWYVPQVNSSFVTCHMSPNRLRFQAFTALAYGAEVINWACWMKGWWTHNVVNLDGTTNDYEYMILKMVNRELHALGPDYMRYRNVATHRINFSAGPKSLDLPDFKAITFSEQSRLVVGEMSARKGTGTAFLAVASDDPHDAGCYAKRLTFRPTGACRVLRTTGAVEYPRPDTNGVVRIYLAASEAVLVSTVGENLSVSSATSMEKVLPRDGVARAEATELKVRLARGETEAVQVFVHDPAKDRRNVRVTVSELTRRSEGFLDAFRFAPTFPSEAVKVSVLGYVETKEPRDKYSSSPYRVASLATDAAEESYLSRAAEFPARGWWPDPILDYLDRVDVKAGDRQGFWLSFRAPRDQDAGVYEGTVTVEADGETLRTLPLAVRVNDFTLPVKSPLPTAITFAPSPNMQFETGETLERAKRLRKDPTAPCNAWKRHAAAWSDFLADHYVTRDNLYHRDLLDDPTRIPALKKLADEGRLDCFNLGYWDYPHSLSNETKTAWRAATLSRLKKSYEAVKAAGLEKYAYLYGCDEVSKKHFACIQWAVGELKAAFPGVPISTTAYDHDYGVGTELASIDWFTPLTDKYDPVQARLARQEGRQVWWYVCCVPHAPCANMFIECPAIEGRILMGAQTAKYRPDGFLYYQTTLWNADHPISGPSAFTDWMARSWTRYNGDGSWVCAGPDSRPLTTVRFENFRDGLEDFAYVKLLEAKLVAEPDAPWAAKARELIGVPRSIVFSMKQFTNDPSVLYAWRDAMADLLEDR